MRHHVKSFVIMMIAQFLNYSLAVYSWRMIAQDNMPAALMVDGVYTTAQFFIIRRIAQSDDTVWAWLGMTVGGVLGTWVGMTLLRVHDRAALSAWFGGLREGVADRPAGRRTMKWRTVWAMTKAGRPPVI